MLLLTFTVGPNRYAVDVKRVIEVLPRVDLVAIPHAPAVLTGLLEYRGSVVPVLDLALLLGSAPCQDCLSTRIILVDDTVRDHNLQYQDQDASRGQLETRQANRKSDPSFLGLVAEHVSDLTYVQPEQIKPAPVLLPQAPYLGAIIQTDHGIVQLIVVEQVRLASIQSSYPGQDPALHSKSDPASLIA
jgi:chemotaxis-related protein WspB